MPSIKSPRPDFKAPPVNEVVLGVQFESLSGLGYAQFGALWERVFRQDFPGTEEKPALPQSLEHLGPPRPQQLNLQIVSDPPPIRFWFTNDEGTELIQVQKDRFIFNWRKSTSEETYPRYPHVKDRFSQLFNKFCDFLKVRGIGDVVPNQCEVTYVNHILAGGPWKRSGQIGQIYSFWSGRHSDRFLPEPEEARFQIQYPMRSDDGELCGRLYVTSEPRITIEDGSPLLRLTLSARGTPLGGGTKGVSKFFDLGREYVVRGFSSITTQRMHRTWERTDAK